MVNLRGAARIEVNDLCKDVQQQQHTPSTAKLSQTTQLVHSIYYKWFIYYNEIVYKANKNYNL